MGASNFPIRLRSDTIALNFGDRSGLAIDHSVGSSIVNADVARGDAELDDLEISAIGTSLGESHQASQV